MPATICDTCTCSLFNGDLTLTFRLSETGFWRCQEVNSHRPYVSRAEAIRRAVIASCTCQECDNLTQPSDLCPECNRCSDGCCTCWECPGYGTIRHPRCAHTCTSDTDRCESCERCYDHCQCSECPNCHARHEEVYLCDRCEYCQECCQCPRCGRCGEDCESTCGQCDRCPECCECEEEESRTVELVKSPLTFHHCKKTECKRNPSKRFISCELEIASAESDSDISRTVRQWRGNIVEDGSLPDSGFEICTAPASGDLFCNQIEEICAALADSSAEVTPACGYHVHIDARDFRYFEIRKLILLYGKIESALFDMVPSSRKSNNMCKRCAESYLSELKTGKECKKSIVKMNYKVEQNESIKYARKEKYHGSRYRALNLHSWFFRGTIECRLAAGTANADKVIAWSILWAGILDYVYSASEKTVQALVDDASKSSLDVLLEICPTEEVRAYVKERTAKFAR